METSEQSNALLSKPWAGLRGDAAKKDAILSDDPFVTQESADDSSRTSDSKNSSSALSLGFDADQSLGELAEILCDESRLIAFMDEWLSSNKALAEFKQFSSIDLELCLIHI